MGQCESHSLVPVTLLLLELANTKQFVHRTICIGAGSRLGAGVSSPAQCPSQRSQAW